MNCWPTNIAPMSEPKVMPPAAKATQNVRALARGNDTSGRRARVCRQKNTASRTATRARVIHRVRVQPSSRCSIHSTRPPTPRTERMPPRWSTGKRSSWECQGSTTRPMPRATTTSGRLMRNTDPHQKYSSSQPPMTGPTAAKPVPRPDHSAMAVMRGRPRYSAPMMDNVVGKTSAAETPPRNRASVSTSTFGAHAASMDAGTVAMAPMTNSSLRPYRSPMLPR